MASIKPIETVNKNKRVKLLFWPVITRSVITLCNPACLPCWPALELMGMYLNVSSQFEIGSP